MCYVICTAIYRHTDC